MAAQSIAATADPVRLREDRAIHRALRILERRATYDVKVMSDPDMVGAFFRARLAAEVREHFEVAFLDNKHALIAVERLFSGSIDSTAVHPRVVAQRALALNAAAVVIAHNHPSGSPEPSVQDRAITWRLREALELVEVRLLDHVVVAHRGATSLARRGWL